MRKIDCLVEDQMQHPVEPARRLQVAAERLFHHQPRAGARARLLQPLTTGSNMLGGTAR